MYWDLCGQRVSLQELGSSSFAGLLSSHAPQLLPGGTWRDISVPPGVAGELPHATTIVAATFDDGVVLASDRRATAGNVISKREVEKVLRCDAFSAIRIAGAL